jgi:hypothetical protein
LKLSEKLSLDHISSICDVYHGCSCNVDG